MLEIPVLAVTTGAWTMLGLLAAFTLLGLLVLLGSPSEDETHEGARKRYVFGVGKFPRLRELPEMRDIPATPTVLGPEGLRKLGKKADATAGLSTQRYRIEEGNRPWELSADIPDSVDAIQIQREEGHVWVTAEGHLTAQPPLSGEEQETFGDLLRELEDRSELRADRRTWAHSAESPEAVNTKRV